MRLEDKIKINLEIDFHGGGHARLFAVLVLEGQSYGRVCLASGRAELIKAFVEGNISREEFERDIFHHSNR